MRTARIDFESLDWQPMATGARQKLVEREGKRIRLIEFTDAFIEHDWCTRGHAGCVLDGQFEIAFEDRTERFGQGEALVIPGGAPGRHKARVVGPLARLFLVEDV